MNQEEIFLLGVGVIIFLKFVIYDNINIILQTIKSFILVLFFIGVIIFVIYSIRKYFQKCKKKKQEEKERISKNEIIEKLFEEDPYEIEELKKLKEKLEDFTGSEDYGKEVEERIYEIDMEIKEMKHRDKVCDLEKKKKELQRDISDLINEKYKRQRELNIKNEKIIADLDIEENYVFLIEDLADEEIKALKDEGFKKINTYDPILEQNHDFLVKQVLNHSLTHTFLVGRIKELLLQYIDYDDVQIHDTRDADITFQINGINYAFEIETGSLLAKKKQLREKVYYLNRKYYDRWYFIVSNRNLIQKYKKYGKCTQRVGVLKIIQKLLNF